MLDPRTHRHSRRATLRTNLAWGIQGGVFMALAFCMLAALPVLFMLLLVAMTYVSQWTGVGTGFFVPEGIALGLRVLWVFPLYLLAGVAGGTIVGLFRPLTRWRLGATVLGMVVGALAYWSMGPVVAAFTEMEVLSVEHLLISIVTGSVVGGAFTFKEWKPG